MKSEYLSEELIKAIRRRPGMYFGSVGAPGVEQFVYELVANVLDLYLINEATFVDVEVDGAAISVTDDGIGLPFDKPSDRDGISLGTQLLTQIHFSRSSDGHIPHVHISTNGVGLAVINVASARLTVQSWRSGLLWEQNFAKGIALCPPTIIKRGIGRGTLIKVLPDPDIFAQTQPRLEVIRRTLFETVHLFPGFRIGLQQECFYAPRGVVSLGYILLDSLFCWTTANSVPFHATLRYKNVLIDAAAFGDNQSRRRIFSWVNGTGTPDSGSHVEGFLQALKEVGWKPVLCLIHIVMYNPQFAGPMGTKLDVPYVREAVRDALCEPLRQYRT